MDELIEALTIFRKYTDSKYPIGCEHDEMYVHVDQALVTAADVTRLDQLGFFIDDNLGIFKSFRFGS